MSYMRAEQKRKIRFGEDGDALMMLIFVNVMVFVILMFIKIVYQLTPIPLELYKSQILDWVTMPHDPMVFLTKPWTLLTHMISQIDVWDMIGNMLFLWAFGYLLQDLMGNRHIVPVFFYGRSTVVFIGGEYLPAV
jgi:membrane associated rhomboid family serine protease